MIATGICIISALLVVIILHLRELVDTKEVIIETKDELGKMWVIAANITGALKDLQESIDLYRKDFKLTFDDKFARRVEEIVGLGVPVHKTMQVIADDGKPHILPIDEGY